ncbi:hypothetical protein [Streptomyces sp. NPDC001530]|uniref:hypothetical protein n=1 Tax=Streptomyces sp. NPDC001530 TaxID=3364582 RepID=UPI00368FBB45
MKFGSEFGSGRPRENVPRPKVEPKAEPLWRETPELDFGDDIGFPFDKEPRLDLKGLAVDVGPLANEKKVLDNALSVIEGMEPPLTLEKVNEKTKHLAITFHEVGEDEESVIALTCPLEPLDPEGATVYDAASAVITGLHGDIDAALLQGVHAELKSDGSLAAGAARCVISGFLIHMMPTSVIGKTVTMLSDAVRGMREKAEQKELEAAKDFAQTQGFAEWLRHREAGESRPTAPEFDSALDPIGIDDRTVTAEFPGSFELFAGPSALELDHGSKELPDASIDLPDETIDFPGLGGPSLGL